MKKTVAVILSVLLASCCLAGCSSEHKIADLSQTTRIEVRIFSSGNAYTDLVISDKDTVRDICDMFSSLELKKVRIVKPRTDLYEMRFFKGNEQRPFESVSTGADNVIKTGSVLYKITNGISLVDCLSKTLENMPGN